MAFEAWLLLNLYECCRTTLSRKEQLRHRAVSLRQHGFFVYLSFRTAFKDYWTVYGILKPIGFHSSSFITVCLIPCHRLKHISQLRFDYDTTMIRRYHGAFDYDGLVIDNIRFAFDSTAIRLRHDYDEKLTCSFFARVESRRMEGGARITS